MPEISECSASQLERTETELNKVYSQVMKAMSALDRPQSEARTKLRDAQRAWVAFRDKDCDVFSTLYSGGSAQGMVVSDCMRRHAEARIKELNAYLEEF